MTGEKLTLAQRHLGLCHLVATPEHDSDCHLEMVGPHARVGTVCTCVAGNAARAILAVLNAHRPDEGSRLCQGDGVLCVDSCENPNDWPCPTVRLIGRAIDERV